MGRIYVISDLHGQADAFFRMLELISFSPEDRMIILGDVIDRGKDGIPLLRYIMEQDNMELLMGNHEDMMRKSLSEDTEEEWFDTWIYNGGGTTISGLNQLSEEEVRRCIGFVNRLPVYKVIEAETVPYLLIHAGVRLEEGQSLEDLCASIVEEDALWIRGEFFNSSVIPPYYIVFGHTPTGALSRYTRIMPADQRERCRNFQIVQWNHRIGIDCGAAYGANLGCLCLNDLREFYVPCQRKT